MAFAIMQSVLRHARPGCAHLGQGRQKAKAKNLIFPPSVNNQIILLIRLIHLIPDRAPYVEYSERYSCFNFFNYFLIIFVCANFPEKDSNHPMITILIQGLFNSIS